MTKIDVRVFINVQRVNAIDPPNTRHCLRAEAYNGDHRRLQRQQSMSS
jgi:hypothetical protein